MTTAWLFPFALVTASCVVGAGSRPTAAAAARSTGEPDRGGVMTVGERRSCPRGEKEPPHPPKPSPDAVWIEGSCHFDGVDFVWIEGRWEGRTR